MKKFITLGRGALLKHYQNVLIFFSFFFFFMKTYVGVSTEIALVSQYQWVSEHVFVMN